MPDPIPITHANPQRDVPHHYRLFERTNVCAHCGAEYSYSEVFAAMPYRSGFSLAPCNSAGDVAFNLPVKVEKTPFKTIPFCHQCWKPGMLNHLPRPQVAVNVAPAKPTWASQPSQPTAAKDKPKSTKDKKPPSLDDLLI